jgi:hypothetical protein
MTKLAYVRGGTVLHVLPLPARSYPDLMGYLVECPDNVGENWLYDGGTWTAPSTAPPIPDVVALWKIKVILSQQPSTANAGHTLLDDANTAIEVSSMAVQLAWANAADVSVTSPALATIATQIGMASTELQQLYLAASQVAL